ncbi:hypothetical protein MMC19_001307 [Ptychographa xylographoides]|nr:hypothetical protein [Ptychographa xylographoides]
MPPISKKRKISACTTREVATAVSKGNIASFGRISKSGRGSQIDKKEEIVEKDGQLNWVSQPAGLVDIGRKKRRKDHLEITPKENLHSSLWGKKPVSTNIDTNVVNALGPVLPIPPLKPRKTAPVRSKKIDTPSKGTRAFLAAFTLSSPSSAIFKSPHLPPRELTPPKSPTPVQSPHAVSLDETILPEELQDLIHLHSSFFTALSLHYAHNGYFTPTDLSVLRPSIERSWGKRRIRTQDIRLIIGILANNDANFTEENETPCPIMLSDYGCGKVCIEFSGDTGQTAHRRQPLNIERLNNRFLDNINKLWNNSHPTTGEDISTFLGTLPLASIETCSSLCKISPLLAKGQRRLEDLKAGAIKAQLTQGSLTFKDVSQPLLSVSRPKLVQSRSSSLLERVQAKQLHQSLLPAPPSAETIARRNALQRLEEVIPVLEILTSSASRSGGECQVDGEVEDRVFSFTMPTLVQHLQMSLRNPICKDEAAQCVRLLAEEITPGWVGLKQVGILKGVTVRRVRGLGWEEIRRRVKEASDKGAHVKT